MRPTTPGTSRNRALAVAVLGACLSRLIADLLGRRLVTLQEIFQICRSDTPLPADIDGPQVAVADPMADRGLPDLEEFCDLLHREELP